MIKCKCINSENRPSVIPEDKWVKKNEEYHIIYTYIIKHPKQMDLLAVDLAEISLNHGEYEHFLADRFAIDAKDIEALLELMKDCSNMNETIGDLNELVKQLELVEK